MIIHYIFAIQKYITRADDIHAKKVFVQILFWILSCCFIYPYKKNRYILFLFNGQSKDHQC